MWVFSLYYGKYLLLGVMGGLCGELVICNQYSFRIICRNHCSHFIFSYFQNAYTYV